MSHCPCGHQKDFSECCEPLHLGSRQAATAEELMRSRYTAFVKGAVDYIIETNHADTRHEINREEVEQWSKASEWKGLEIVNTEAGSDSDEKGMVEFRANYTVEGKSVVHHEKADFTKVDDRWYFVDGEILREAYRREHPKVGRNDPCFCGSGKKYKKCCYLTL